MQTLESGAKGVKKTNKLQHPSKGGRGVKNKQTVARAPGFGGGGGVSVSTTQQKAAILTIF